MKLFEKHQEKQHKNKDYTIIVGCGRLGASLASRFSEDGGNVLVIDEDKNSFRKLSPNYGGMVIQGDATEISVLKRAEIKNATSVIAVTNHDNTNVMVAQLAKELFHKMAETIIHIIFRGEFQQGFPHLVAKVNHLPTQFVVGHLNS